MGMYRCATIMNFDMFSSGSHFLELELFGQCVIRGATRLSQLATPLP